MGVLTGNRDKLVFLMLALYFFTVVFGGLFRAGDEETGYGLSTLLLVLVILFKWKDIPRGLFGNSLFLTILALFAWCLLSAQFSVTSVRLAYQVLAMLFAYLFVAVAVREAHITEERVRLLIYMLGISILIASVLTIIDFLKIYNIPYVNEADVTTKIQGERIEQAGGFFSRRSAMAAYYSLIIPTLAYYAFKIGNFKEKVFMFGAAGTGYLALFLTHNRSGVVGILLALFVYMALDQSLRFTQKIRMMVYGIIASGIVLFIAFMYFPEHFEVYIVKLASYLPGGGDVSAEKQYLRSDYSRVYFFMTVIQSLLSNPIGNGFSKIYSAEYGISSPHNIITYIIWAAGIMAFVWVPFFILQVRKHFSLGYLRFGSKESANTIILVGALQVGLLSWLLNNMAHNSLTTGLAWMYMGIILNLLKTAREKQSMTTSDVGAQKHAGSGRLDYIPRRTWE